MQFLSSTIGSRSGRVPGLRAASEDPNRKAAMMAFVLRSFVQSVRITATREVSAILPCSFHAHSMGLRWPIASYKIRR